MDEQNALVLFSGGQDSTTCLAWALARFDRVETIGFNYRQRNRVELDQRPRVVAALRRAFPQWAAKLGDDHRLDLAALAEVSDSAMTRDVAIAAAGDGLPNTFVPGRNLLFLTFAAAVAYRRGLGRLVAGVCETDYSGYPDCRDDSVKALQVALNLGMATRLAIETPLMWIDKAATWRLARDLGGEALIDIVREDTHTCYEGDRAHRHDWGYGCGHCPACALRAAGYAKFVAKESGAERC